MLLQTNRDKYVNVLKLIFIAADQHPNTFHQNFLFQVQPEKMQLSVELRSIIYKEATRLCIVECNTQALAHLV